MINKEIFNPMDEIIDLFFKEFKPKSISKAGARKLLREHLRFTVSCITEDVGGVELPEFMGLLKVYRFLPGESVAPVVDWVRTRKLRTEGKLTEDQYYYHVHKNDYCTVIRLTDIHSSPGSHWHKTLSWRTNKFIPNTALKAKIYKQYVKNLFPYEIL
jgi:hypothetical protein